MSRTGGHAMRRYNGHKEMLMQRADRKARYIEDKDDIEVQEARRERRKSDLSEHNEDQDW